VATGKARLSELARAAKEASEDAYSPYSDVKIGAAVLTSSGKIFRGCNVENSSYGLSCCAERVAIFNAVSAGHRSIVSLVIYGASDDLTKPCGACRQVMVEFNPDMTVHQRGADGFSDDTIARTLLPSHFRPAGLTSK